MINRDHGIAVEHWRVQRRKPEDLEGSEFGDLFPYLWYEEKAVLTDSKLTTSATSKKLTERCMLYGGGGGTVVLFKIFGERLVPGSKIEVYCRL